MSDINDPFVAGQMVGILTILAFIEKNNGIPKDFLAQLQTACADKAAEFLKVPAEDVHLTVNELVAKIKEI